MTLGIRRDLTNSFDDVLARIPDALKAEGFGVLTDIDLAATFKAKLGVDFRRYKILGACNPKLAHQALETMLEVGIMLPCNVVVYERDDGGTTVIAIDPMQTMATQHESLSALAADVQGRLSRVIAQL